MCPLLSIHSSMVLGVCELQEGFDSLTAKNSSGPEFATWVTEKLRLFLKFKTKNYYL